MDGNRRLGWIAIAIGSVALVVALMSFGRESRFAAREDGWQDRGSYGQSQSERPGDGFGRGGNAARGDEEARGQGPFGPERDGFAGRGEFGPRHSPFGLLFLPFLLFGGLLKLALIGGLIFLVLRLLSRGRRGGPGGPFGPFGRGGPGGHGWPHEHDHPHTPATPPAAPQNRPGPEPYTGETTNL